MSPAGMGSYVDNTGTPWLNNGFICRFREDGQLQWSTYWGDNTSIFGMAISQRRLIVTGGTVAVLPFPMDPIPSPATWLPPDPTSLALNNTEVFVSMFNAIDQSHWNCYLGGMYSDGGYDVRSLGNDFYVYGNTQSPDFDTQADGSAYFNNVFGSGVMGSNTDAFIARFDSWATLKWSTFFGGTETDIAGMNGLAISPYNGDVYIVGAVRYTTNAPSAFPLIVGSVGYFDGVKDPGSNGFIARFAGSNRSLKWCTYFGAYNNSTTSTAFHMLETVAVDRYGVAYVGGETASPNMPVLADPNGFSYYQPLIEPNVGEDNDTFVAMFKPVDDSMGWCTYFGGQAGTVPEYLRTLLPKENALFAGGRTSKPTNLLTSYFPLQANGGYYDDTYNDLGFPISDIFLAKFCTPWSDLIEDPKRLTFNESSEEAIMCWCAAEHVSCTLQPAGQSFVVLASDGRICASVGINATSSSGPWSASLPQLAPGAYIIRFASGRTLRYIQP